MQGIIKNKINTSIDNIIKSTQKKIRKHNPSLVYWKQEDITEAKDGWRKRHHICGLEDLTLFKCQCLQSDLQTKWNSYQNLARFVLK